MGSCVTKWQKKKERGAELVTVLYCRERRLEFNWKPVRSCCEKVFYAQPCWGFSTLSNFFSTFFSYSSPRKTFSNAWDVGLPFVSYCRLLNVFMLQIGLSWLYQNVFLIFIMKNSSQPGRILNVSTSLMIFHTASTDSSTFGNMCIWKYMEISYNHPYSITSCFSLSWN